MSVFGLDPAVVKTLKGKIDIKDVSADQAEDFFALPQLYAIYKQCGADLLDQTLSRLSSGKFSPKLPLYLDVPKSSKVRTKFISNVANVPYYRPGAVLFPHDRVIYHHIGQRVAAIANEALDWTTVYSNRPVSSSDLRFRNPGAQWRKLRNDLELEAKSGKYTHILKCDIAQYFTSINQHELINSLEHHGIDSEMRKFSENFLTDITLDRSSRGIVQGSYASDSLGNFYLSAIDEFIKDCGVKHFRYVDDFYILFQSYNEFQRFFPRFSKALGNYDMALNEAKSFVTSPLKLVREETELDRAIRAAKKEAQKKLTEYQFVEIDDDSPYSRGTALEVIEVEPPAEAVTLSSTISIFENLDDFRGDERSRAETFSLAFFRRAADDRAVDYVLSRWDKHPEKAKEYIFYLNVFLDDKKVRGKILKTFEESSKDMIDFQWAWAAMLMRRSKEITPDLLKAVIAFQRDKTANEVVRSLLTYAVARHGTAAQKKTVRDAFSNEVPIVQLATVHASQHFTGGERNAFLKTVGGHSDLADLLIKAMKTPSK